MNYSAVIGANYGDEGKGLVTDWLTMNGGKTLNILTNGTCQRGHTVEHADGKRHVFHHFGSGTLRGATTFIPYSFSVNPQVFVKEYEELGRPNLSRIWIDRTAPLIIPIDIALNQVIESARGSNRHGSVGQGLWESMLREPLSVQKFLGLDRRERVELLHEYNNTRVLERLKEAAEETGVSVEKMNTFLLWMVNTNDYINHYIDDFERMVKSSILINRLEVNDFAKDYDQVIFENGQGLMLDRDYAADKRHSTPSNTGLNAVDKLIDHYNFEVNVIEAYYVTRTYITRHGNGPFPEENSLINFNDHTNVPNEWQGSLRFGRLNPTELIQRINRDIKNCTKRVNPTLFITHNNELPPSNELMLSKINKLYSWSPFNDKKV